MFNHKLVARFHPQASKARGNIDGWINNCLNRDIHSLIQSPDMRLKLVIVRHGLPVTRILWTVADGSRDSHTVPSSAITSTRTPNVAYGDEGCTIAQLLEDINEVVPLETSSQSVGENDELGGQWGLEDYVVEFNGFECLHFMHVDGLLKDGDEVV